MTEIISLPSSVEIATGTTESEPRSQDSALVPVQPCAKLARLAKRINEEHVRCIGSQPAGQQHAMKAGRFLLKAKQLVPHGDWLKWLKDNVEVSRRTAQVYMQLAKGGPADRANAQTAALLALRESQEVDRRSGKGKPQPEAGGGSDGQVPGSLIPPPWSQTVESDRILKWLKAHMRRWTAEQRACVVPILEGIVSNLKAEVEPRSVLPFPQEEVGTIEQPPDA
jgi:hypothetical protein